MLAVIADDITGAAEIAGIAHRYGLSCQLSIGLPSSIDPQSTDIIVIATDTRSLSAQQAYDITADITRQLCSILPHGKVKIFRKTDSALRGNVQDELQAIIDNSQYTHAVFMPANPSKGRIIKDGVYYIRTADDEAKGVTGTPLSETDFRFDPEFPATSSVVKERFPLLNCPDATSQADIDAIVNNVLQNADRVGEATFLAGAADLFTSLIKHLYNLTTNTHATVSAALAADPTTHHPSPLPPHSSKVIVRGSTQSKAIDLGIPVETMPLDVFYETSAPCIWAASILNRHCVKGVSLQSQQPSTHHLSPITRSLILTIGDKEVRPGKQAAVYLRQAMAEVTNAVIAAITPDELIIEGGATAYAILSQTPWNTFRITDEIAPGVVRMQPSTSCSDVPRRNTPPHITLKPGSYSWGKLFNHAQ